MIACPVCGEELEGPVRTLWDLMVGLVTCVNCGSETGVIHPSAPQPVFEGGDKL
jgi:rRNA maturation protein Nop10